MSRPVIFLSDYGLEDGFVGICRGVLEKFGADRVIDLDHFIPPHDVLRGAALLADAVPYFPDGAVYLAVVDPGVGGQRRALAVEARSGAHLVGPDNGLLSLAWEALGGVVHAVEITSSEVLLHPVSPTFDGRDVFAPAAAHLATDGNLSGLGPAVDAGALERAAVPAPVIGDGRVEAEVLSVDRFGNVRLNVRPHDLATAGIARVVLVNGAALSLAKTFSDVPQDRSGALWDSSGWLALVVNQGSAADRMGLRPASRALLTRG